jgi:hypothetical protein
MLKLLPIFAIPYTEMNDFPYSRSFPKRVKLRTDIELPIKRKSNTDKEDPTRPTP